MESSGEGGRAMSDFKGRHFAGEIVLWAVRWYCRYGISYRDLEQMMAERGVSVDHATIYRWVQKYAPEIEKRAALALAPPALGELAGRRDLRESRRQMGLALPSCRQAGQHDRFLSIADAEHDGGEAFPRQGPPGAEELGAA